MLNVKIPGIDVRSFMNNKAILQMVVVRGRGGRSSRNAKVGTAAG
jgi:hypothetical protein